MKKVIINSLRLLLIPAFALTFSSCQTKNGNTETEANATEKDSKDVAEDMNKDKFNEKDTKADAQFVVDAIAANYAEIRLAELGEKLSTDKEVKELSAMLVKQHTKLVGELKKYAEAKVISVPTDETTRDENKAENLADKKDFDKKWCADMKDLHEKTIKKFEDETTDAADPELKNLATTALPEIRTHYDKIVACHDRLK